MAKGPSGSQVITVLSNAGSSGTSYTLTLTGTSFAAGASVTELYTCTRISVGSGGSIAVPMTSGLPRAVVPTTWLSGSSLCGGGGGGGGTGGKCTPESSVPILFEELATTTYGENIFLSGSISQLGNWNANSAVALSASQYTTSNPLWETTVNIPAGTAFQYKFIRKESNGSIVWESDPNRSYTVPTPCVGVTETVTASWR